MLVHSKIYSLVSVGVVTVVKNVHPPPPPPRKALPATPSVDPPVEKPTQSPARNLQIPTTPSIPLETHGNFLKMFLKQCLSTKCINKKKFFSSSEHSLHNSFEEGFYEDVEEPEAPAVSTFRPPSTPSSDSSSKRPVSIHEEAFLKQLSTKQQVKEDVFLNKRDKDIVDVDYASVNSGSLNPDTQAAVLQDSVRSSPALSPSG